MLTKKFVLLGGLALVLCAAFAFTLVACDDGGSGLPTSVGDYSTLEPAMEPNPNRATARAGGTTTIGIPDHLLASVSSRAAATATFAVHEGDADIAQIIAQNGSTCTVKGLKLGSARIIITVESASSTVIIAVSPSAAFYTLPAASVRQIGTSTTAESWWTSNQPDSLPSDFQYYRAEPTNQIAWNWRNPTQSLGASGTNCGIDFLAYYVDPAVSDRRGWVRTTFGFGGWHYDLNGVTNAMTDGVQTQGDVTLELKPEFIYDNGVPYLQITHKLTNNGTTALTDQKFGASADVMIIGNDRAPVYHLPYGALMTNEYKLYGVTYLPTMKFRLVCQEMLGVDDASTMWIGTFSGERDYIYVDQRDDITVDDDRDTALNFSYQNINLNPGQSKTFVVRFTQVQ
jgi:hypothetical protein